MKNQASYIDRLINSIGTETFIKYFNNFANSNSEELIAIFTTNNEPWKENSKGQKASNGKRIFEEKLELEALEHIFLNKKENNIPNGLWVKKRAKEIYMEYNQISVLRFEEESITQIEKEILTKYRLQQGVFRTQLLLYWEGCSITECKNSALLIASHIKPYSESTDIEKYDISNGLILTPTYDKLFDCFLISFNYDGKILISASITQEDLAKLKITGNETLKMKKVTPAIQKYIGFHRQKFEQKEKTKAKIV